LAEISQGHDITLELAFGETSEVGIITRWSKLSDFAKRSKLVTKTPPHSPFDFLLLDRKGFPLAYLEIKRRRTSLVKYGDAMCPMSKVQAAKAIYAEFSIPSLLVTEYGCGSIIEVLLTTQPKQRKDVARRDRPGMRPVAHALYTRDQLTVLKREDA
jgi:hypothetical protein